NAPTIEPALQQANTSGCSCCSYINFKKPACATPRVPPPDNTSPKGYFLSAIFTKIRNRQVSDGFSFI
ncbi:MAG TPA: hypothetical protein DCW95_05725, partial [Chryseobacterium sp.]|nr:hypothetical protein [Chryseobacterium sp.]